MFLLAASLGAMGVLLASRMRTMEGFFVVNQMVVMPMVFLSGVFFPVVRELPAWLGVVVRINPVAYGVDSVRQLMLGGTIPPLTLFGHPMAIWQDAVVVALFGLLMVGLAIRSFSRAE
jgi:ABC-2 type transport system permease protein